MVGGEPGNRLKEDVMKVKEIVVYTDINSIQVENDRVILYDEIPENFKAKMEVDLCPDCKNLKCTYCGYVLTEKDSDMMWQEFCPMCEKERKVDLCPDCKVYCEKRFIDGRCE